MATHLTWTRKSYWRARGPDGEYVAKENGSTNFATPEELWEGIANSPLRGEFDVEPARFRVSKGYGVLSPDTGDTSPPTVPTDLSGSPVSASSIFLSWTASTDNVGVTEYQVYRNGVPIDTTQDTNYTDSGLTPSTQYSYQVSASDAAGNSSGLTSAAQVTTNANTAPSWSTSAQSLTIGVAYSLALSSVCSDADGHALTFTQVSGTLPAGLTFSNGVVSGTPTTAGTPAVTFRANDGYTTVDRTITFTVTQADTTPPDVPTGLAVGIESSTTIPLTWNANPGGQGLAGYNIYRSTSQSGTYSKRNSSLILTNSYTDAGLNAETTYWYKVSAVDNATPVANESAQSSAVSGTTEAAAPDWIATLPATFTAVRGAGVQDFPVSGSFYPTYLNLADTVLSPLDPLSSDGNEISKALPAEWSFPDVTPPVLRFDDSGSGAVAASSYRFKATRANAEEADWLTRISTSGVVWYHNFENSREVDNFRWTGGIGNDPNDSGSYADCQWDSTDGFAGGGCILNRRAAGFSNDGSGWIRPFSPIVGGTTSGNGRGVGNDDPGAGITPLSWSVSQGGNQTENWPHGFYGNSTYHSEYSGQFDGQDYWIQLRLKTPATNWTQSGLTGGKCLFFQHTYGALPNQQIVLPAIVDTLTGAANGTGGRFILFRSGSPTLQSDHQATHGVDASQVIEGETTAQSCNFGLRAANCWAFPGDVWVTLLFYFKLGLQSNSDTTVKVWAAYAGDDNNGLAYTKIWDQTCVDLPYDSNRPKGHNSIWTSGGANMSGTPSVDFVQKFTQFIFKKGNGSSSDPETDGIPCPQA